MDFCSAARGADTVAGFPYRGNAGQGQYDLQDIGLAEDYRHSFDHGDVEAVDAHLYAFCVGSLFCGNDGSFQRSDGSLHVDIKPSI